MTPEEVEKAYASLPEHWQDVVELPDRERAIVIIGVIVRMHKMIAQNHDTAIAAFNSR